MAVDKIPRIEQIQARRLVGVSRRMSVAEDATPELWRSFMPRRGEVEGRLGSDVISLRTFDVGAGHGGAELFAPHVLFDKYALVEVNEAAGIPEGMLSFTIPAGQYAVFTHRGPAHEAPATFQYIFGQWLPDSPFEFEPRPQFEILPEGYHPMDRDAQEEIWIPVRTANP